MDEGVKLRQDLKAQARALGFEAFGIARPQHDQSLQDNLAAFLAEGRQASMDWMALHAARRADPRSLMPNLKSIVVLGANYGPAHDPLEDLTHKDRGAISVYARGRDYHDVLKKRLKALGRKLADQHGAEIRVFVDTAPVMEKPLAAAAGLGWQGKHTNLVSRDFGSWLFLGVIFTSLDLPFDTAHEDHCGACQACLDICPTGAITAPYQIDARRCISYLTIEHKDHIDAALMPLIGNRIYGCDDCLAACPWNKFAVKAEESGFKPRMELQRPRLGDLAALDEEAFRALFSGSPLKRIGRDRFIRNVMIAIGNSGQSDLAPSAQARLEDASPLVRRAAVWALAQLLSPARFRDLRALWQKNETDTEVRKSWDF